MRPRLAITLFTALLLPFTAACSKTGSSQAHDPQESVGATSKPTSRPTSKPTSKPTSRPSKAAVVGDPADPRVLPIPDESQIPDGAELATVAGGCFWCVEETFMQLPGVHAVISGYAGGREETADYKKVSSGVTDHAEAVQVFFDPAQVSYRKIIDHFWKVHDPTTLNQQGNDHGPQYRSAIFFHDEAQKEAALASMAELDASGKYSAKAVTQIVPLTTYFDAEEYHQNYYRKNPDDRYCIGVLVPKLRKLGMQVAGELPPVLREEAGNSGAGLIAPPSAGWVKPSDDELKDMLNSTQYDVTQKDGTERAFTGPYWDNKEEGVYVDIVGGRPLFSSRDKFKSGTGWPSFTQPIDEGEIAELADNAHGWERVEVRSKTADSHLGHVFPDGPAPTGLRYCINGNALRFIPKADLEKEGLADLKKLFEDPKP